MAILPSDVKLYESQRLTDENDGGGLATGNVVADGQVNNLFPDISRLDRTIGDVALRKCFVGIDTANADVYLGAHTIITKKPADPLVSALLFETNNPNDERAAAQSQIESYVVRGARSNWFILGNQYVGQRIIIGFQDPTQEIPEVGEVFELWDPTESFNQYFRITTVEAEIETFSYQTGNTFLYLDKRKLTLGISSPLENTYIGGTPSPGGTTGPASTINSTEVADAAKYYGVSDLAVVGAPGDLIVEVDSVYSHLVPSAQSESVFADQIGAFQRALFEPATAGGKATQSQTISYADSALTGYTLRPIMPGTAVVTAASSVYVDNGQGVAEHSSGSDLYDVTLDYSLGIVAAKRKTQVSGNGTLAVNYQPAAPLIGQAETGNIDVTLQNRAFNWTLNLAESKPRPGTLVVSYMALGKWQTLYDLGDGELGGQGSGTISFATGTAIVTLPVMPDAGTAIVYSYIANVDGEFEAIEGPVAQRPKHSLQLEPGVKPGSVVITWTSGTAKTATDDGKGVISGDADGFIAYATGEVIIEPVTVIDNNTNITIDYEFFTPSLESFGSVPDQTGVSDFTILGAPVLPGSVTLRYNVNQRQKLIRSNNPGEISWADQATVEIVLVDDGLGGFLNDAGEQIGGSINYATGLVSVTTENDVAIPAIVGQVKSGFLNRSYRTKSVFGVEFIRQSIQGAINCYYQPDTVNHGPQQLIEPITELTLDLVALPNGIAPGSLWFNWDGNTYTDNGGVIERNKAYATGAGTAVGTIDYATGEVVMTTWPDGAAASVEVEAMVTQNAAMATSVVIFRTPGRPLRPGSLQITAVRQDTSETITATADADGSITGDAITGFVNTETGLVQLWFTTDALDDTGASDVPVYPGSVRYNAVSYAYLPLDADLIGVDPVRLPADGRVPIFRDGDVIVVAHEQISAVGSPAAGEVVSLPRAYLAYCQVIDANDVPMDPSEYVNDLDAGTITFNNPVTFVDANSQALTLPLRAIERVEHMTVVSDAQVSGSLSMISPLPHDYPLGSTVSSALLFGDINARAFAEFTQKSWNSSSPNWTDNRIGDDTTASYNLVDSPIVVNNNGAISEKWALVFTGSSNFNIVGETVGIIGTGTINTDTAPLNPNTGNPYFVLLAAGWGSGWTSGNVLRFNSDGCLAPIWMSRTVLSGKGTADDDSVTLQIRGDAD